MTPSDGAREYTGTPDFRPHFGISVAITPRMVASLKMAVAAGMVLDLHEVYPFPFGFAVLAAGACALDSEEPFENLWENRQRID